jgi:hypothetical protein
LVLGLTSEPSPGLEILLGLISLFLGLGLAIGIEWGFELGLGLVLGLGLDLGLELGLVLGLTSETPPGLAILLGLISLFLI